MTIELLFAGFADFSKARFLLEKQTLTPTLSLGERG